MQLNKTDLLVKTLVASMMMKKSTDEMKEKLVTFIHHQLLRTEASLLSTTDMTMTANTDTALFRNKMKKIFLGQQKIGISCIMHKLQWIPMQEESYFELSGPKSKMEHIRKAKSNAPRRKLHADHERKKKKKKK